MCVSEPHRGFPVCYKPLLAHQVGHALVLDSHELGMQVTV